MISKDLTNKLKVEINQIKLKNVLEKIRSKYILQQIFDNVNKKNILNIIKYNKTLKSKLNITKKDYKELCKIEIEIIPERNKYFQFINININEKSFFHIYFDEDKEEKKRNYLNRLEKVD